MSTRQVALYLTDGNGTHHELIAGLIDEKLVPGFIVTLSRFRHYFPVDVYFDGKRCVSYSVKASGVFYLQLKQVPHG